jgi:type IV pilus assembly protein PilC
MNSHWVTSDQSGQASFNTRVKHSAVTSHELTDFTRQLATLVSSGVPLLESLDAVHKCFADQAMAHIVDQMKSRISAGWALHQALQEHAVFGHLYCQMVAAGELSGNLDEMLNRLALHTERQQQLIRKLRMASVYPVAVLLIAFGVVAVILIWVVPVFQSIFASFGAELPFATRLIVNMSKHLLHWGLPVILMLATLAFIFRWQYQRDERWQWLLAVWVLHLPVVSHLIGSANLVIWTRCMAMLMQSGVPLLDTLQIVAGTCTNRVYALSTLTVHDRVMQGISLAQALRQLSSDADGYPPVFSKLYPSLLVQLIDIGEQSGTLSALLNKAADSQDEALAHQVQSMTQLIEPLLVVVLGGLVGGMVVALYLPIFQLGQIM